MPPGSHDTHVPVAGAQNRICFFLIAAGAGAVLFGHLGLLPLWGSEGRWGVISRFMFESGDLLRPMLGNDPYWDKPLVSYWQVLPAAHALGRVDELAARLPSAVWALLLLLLTHDLARKWLGPTRALVSSALLATSYGFVFWGRNAQVEMTNAAVIMLVLWLFFTRKPGRRPLMVIALAGMMGLGANMKGLTAVGVPAFCILACSFMDRDWDWVPGPLALASAALVFGAAFFMVPVAGCLASSSWEPLELMWKENVVRFFAPFDHKGPFYLYFYRIFDLCAPWSLFLPPALVHAHKAKRFREKGVRQAFIVFISIFLFFSLSGSRRSYYLLPILPFASMVSGDFLTLFARRRLPWDMDAFTKAAGILIAALFSLPLVFLLIKPHSLPVGPSILPWSLVLPAGGTLMAWSFFRRCIPGMILPAGAVWLLYVYAVLPWQASLPGDIRDETRRINTMNRPVAFLNSTEAKVIFYLDKQYTVLPDLPRARAWAEMTDGILITDKDIRDPTWIAFINDHALKAYILRHPLRSRKNPAPSHVSEPPHARRDAEGPPHRMRTDAPLGRPPEAFRASIPFRSIPESGCSIS